MECLGCGAEVASETRWCERCDIAASSRAHLVNPPPGAPEPDLQPLPPTPWAYAQTPPPPGPPGPPTTTYPPAYPPSYAPPLPPPGRGESRVGIGVAVAAWIVLVAVAAVGAFLVLHHSKSKTVASSSITTPTNPPSATDVPPGYSEFVDRADSFRIAVPTAWRQINPSSPGATQEFQRVIQAIPKFADTFGPDASSFVTKHIKFFAIDLNFAGLSPNVNIAAIPALGIRDSDLPDALTEIRKSYDRLGLEILRSASVRLDGHAALKLTLRAPTSATFRKTHVPPIETQYYVAANDFLYTVTFTGTSAAFPVITRSFHTS